MGSGSSDLDPTSAYPSNDVSEASETRNPMENVCPLQTRLGLFMFTTHQYEYVAYRQDKYDVVRCIEHPLSEGESYR